MSAAPFTGYGAVVYSPPPSRARVVDPPPGARVEVRIVPNVPPAPVPAARPDEV